MEGRSKITKNVAVVLDDIGNRMDQTSKMNEEFSESNGEKMEEDVKRSEAVENNQEEEEEESRPYRRRKKKKLPHWRQLRVETSVMERIMERLKGANPSSGSVPSSASQPQTGAESVHSSKLIFI